MKVLTCMAAFLSTVASVSANSIKSTESYLINAAADNDTDAMTMCGALMINQQHLGFMPKGGPQICLYVPAEDDEFKSLPIKAHWTTRGCTCKFYRDEEGQCFNEENLVTTTTGPMAIEEAEGSEVRLPSMYTCSETLPDMPDAA